MKEIHKLSNTAHKPKCSHPGPHSHKKGKEHKCVLAVFLKIYCVYFQLFKREIYFSSLERMVLQSELDRSVSNYQSHDLI